MQNRLKTQIALVMAVIMVMGCLTGCSKTRASNADTGELSIYYLSGDQNVTNYITAFSSAFPEVAINDRSFEDVDQMDEIIVNELNAGKGPDIIIFSRSNNLDVLRLAESGAFVCLDEHMKADGSLKAENYLPGALEAGKVDGKQYILPLTFSLPIVTYNAVPELGLQMEPIISFGEFASALDVNLERFADDGNKGAIAFSSLFVPLLVAGDAMDFSDNNRKVEYDDAKLENMLSVMKKINTETGKIGNITAAYGGDFLNSLNRFSILLDNPKDFIHQSWIMNNYYAYSGAENFRVSAISQGTGKEIAVILNSFGAITQNADSRAYDFLRLAMDANLISNKTAAYGLPLKKDVLKNQIEIHKTMTSNLETNTGTIKMEGLPDHIADDLNVVLDGITDVKLFNARVMEILTDSFDSYLEGKGSYEDGLKDFKQKMEIYTTE